MAEIAESLEFRLQPPKPPRYRLPPVVQPNWYVADLFAGLHGDPASRLSQVLCARYGARYCLLLDANSTTYWQLRRWLADFEVFNAVPYILRHPADYNRSRFFWRMLAIAPERLLDILTFASPAFVFVLRKP